MKVLARKILRKFGYELVKLKESSHLPVDFVQEVIEVIRLVRPYTMTSVERIAALVDAVNYVEKAKIPGSIVECGVWRGGSMMAIAYTLKRLGACNRDLYLFDTFEGMTKPTDVDVSHAGQPASIEFNEARTSNEGPGMCHASIEDVRSNLLATGYDPERLKFIKGRVEETIPEHAPPQISILRLDTDWYESTSHELMYLFPRLCVGGVIIIDDYGHWQGVRKSVDEYVDRNNTLILLNRIDYTGRMAIKQ